MVAHSHFPPSFDDNPWSYGLALFVSVLISSLCLAQLMNFWFVARQRRAVSRPQPLPLHSLSPVHVYRMQLVGLLLALLLRVFPDALVMLAWGEADDSTMTVLFSLDRWLDTIAGIPFVMAVVLIAWAEQPILQILIQTTDTHFTIPSWAVTRDKLKKPLRIGVMALVIAAGVTAAKAGL